MYRAVLVDRKVVPCGDLNTWAMCMDSANRHVARTDFNDGSFVSTVFLGINHGFGSKPEWFETMYFNANYEGQDAYRTATWDEAEVMHKEIVSQVERRGATGGQN